ncbi:hypothetical protein [Streptomyces sp. NPDC048516]|uniref:hypothetical protein n=1 Tax=Streptomyces sp. NPDC048516 TaxID=3365565 RepID=UPI00371701AF
MAPPQTTPPVPARAYLAGARQHDGVPGWRRAQGLTLANDDAAAITKVALNHKDLL